jgi:dienelactone hydrolase
MRRRISFHRLVLACVLVAWAAGLATAARALSPAARALSPAETRARFHALLDRPKVPLAATSASSSEGEFSVERGRFQSEAKEAVPFLLYKPAGKEGRLPAVIVLHGTGGNKEGMAAHLKRLASAGMLALAIDARYHGERVPGGAHGAQEYNEAVIRAWREGDPRKQEHPFYYDTVYDLWRTVDYLQSRPDVDPKRIGMIGFSMGGIQTWFAAATDERIRVAVPAIGVQSLRWSLENERWQGRAKTIQRAHEEAAKDLGEPEVNAKVCRALWNKIVPGILDEFDCPQMLRAIAPRPLLIVNGENDPNCPLPGAKLAIAAAEDEYRKAKAEEHLKWDVAAGVGHQVTAPQMDMAVDWLKRWLKDGK